MSTLRIPDPDDREDLGTFVGRAVRLDPGATVRLRAADGRVTAWATTPFAVLAVRSVPATLEPDDVVAPAVALLTALSVDRADTVDPGAGAPGEAWRAPLPPAEGWAVVDHVPVAALEALTDRGLERARDTAGPLGPPPALLDETALTVTGAAGDRAPEAPSRLPGGAGAAGPRPTTAPVRVPLRCLFALSGLGLLDGGPDGTVRVSATRGWLRLDARDGAVVRRRTTALPLLTA